MPPSVHAFSCFCPHQNQHRLCRARPVPVGAVCRVSGDEPAQPRARTPDPRSICATPTPTPVRATAPSAALDRLPAPAAHGQSPPTVAAFTWSGSSRWLAATTSESNSRASSDESGNGRPLEQQMNGGGLQVWPILFVYSCLINTGCVAPAAIVVAGLYHLPMNAPMTSPTDTSGPCWKCSRFGWETGSATRS